MLTSTNRLPFVSGLTVLALLPALGWLAGAQGDEPPPALRAPDLLPPAQVTGPHHKVGEAVSTPEYLHVFSITSDFGPFEAVGRTQLAVRLQEIAALAALQEVSKSEVFLKAAGQSVVNVGKGAASAVTDPAGTAKGIGGGIKRVGVNLGRRTQRAVDSATDEGDARRTKPRETAAVRPAMRPWACSG